MPEREVSTKAEFDTLIAKTGDQLIVVDFTAAWCGPCQKIKPIFTQLANEFPHVIFVKVDVDLNQETAQACKVTAMPTFQFFKEGDKWSVLKGGQTLTGEPAASGGPSTSVSASSAADPRAAAAAAADRRAAMAAAAEKRATQAAGK